MLCCFCEITQTWFSSCLKTSKQKSILSEAILIKVFFDCFPVSRLHQKIEQPYQISASSSKGVKFVVTWKPVNSFLTSTVDKTKHMPVIAPFSVYVLCKMSSLIFLAILDLSQQVNNYIYYQLYVGLLFVTAATAK